jgi:hypothetical protein
MPRPADLNYVDPEQRKHNRRASDHQLSASGAPRRPAAGVSLIRPIRHPRSEAGE